MVIYLNIGVSKKMTALRQTILNFQSLQGLMMKKINFAASYFDAETIYSMNSVPCVAVAAVQEYDSQIPVAWMNSDGLVIPNCKKTLYPEYTIPLVPKEVTHD